MTPKVNKMRVYQRVMAWLSLPGRCLESNNCVLISIPDKVTDWVICIAADANLSSECVWHIM